jgi:hypothetical protein
MDDGTLLATCLIWCLADVFACQRQGVSSWRIHLQGIKALIDGNRIYQDFGADPRDAQKTAMRHLYLLYLSLQTLPYVPSLGIQDDLSRPQSTAAASQRPLHHPKIDGFLGYSEELLYVMQQINQISAAEDASPGDPSAEGTKPNPFSQRPEDTKPNPFSPRPEADILLGRVKGMIARDAKAPPAISISSVSLSTEHGREFALCHATFQRAALVQVYRRLYHMPSGSPAIQAAIAEMQDMVGEMTQGQPCHTWVAMAMPLFTIGCEAYSEGQRRFVLDKVDKFEACLGSLHVRIIRQALQDMWNARTELGDVDGELCSSRLLGS